MTSKITAEGIGEGQTSHFRPKDAVVNETPALLLQAVAQGVDVFAQHQEKKQQKAVGSVISSFTEQQLLLADAVEQGKMTQAQAQRESRRALVQAQSANPLLSEKLLSVHKGLLDEETLAAAIEQGTFEQQKQQELEGEAIRLGFIKTTDSDELKEKGIEEYLNIQLANARAASETNQLNLVDKLDARALRQAKSKSQSAVGSFVGASQGKMAKDLQNIVEDHANGRYDSAVDAINDIITKFAAYESDVLATAGPQNGEYATKLMGPTSSLKELAIGTINGSIAKTAMDNHFSNMVTKYKMEWVEDPKFAVALAGNELFRNSDFLSLDVNLTRAIAEKLSSLGSEDPEVQAPNFLDGKNLDNEDSLSLIKQQMRMSVNGELDGAGDDAINRAAGKVLDSVNLYRSSATNPKQFRPVMNFFASQDYGDYSSSNGGVDVGLASKADETIEAQYNNIVEPLIKKEYERSTVRISTGTRTSRADERVSAEVIQPFFNGVGVEFRPIPEMSSNPNVQAEARNLNKKLAKELNLMIWAGAHLQGNKNYKKVYDDKFFRFFGVEQEETKPKEVSTPDPVEGVLSNLPRLEGEGDLLTNIDTGSLGVTDAARKAVGASQEDSDEKVAEDYLNFLESEWQGVEGFSGAPADVKQALLDSSFNAGPQVLKFPKLKKALEAGDDVGVVTELLDTANVDDKSVKGLALRRAEAYNLVADKKIDSVELKDDGTIIYKAGDEVVLSYKPKGGRHEKSIAGTVSI